MAVDWSQFAVGGATRPDSFSGMQAPFLDALSRMMLEAPEGVRGSLRVSSGYRSPKRQTELWQQALKKYGSPSAARKWVAPPGRSQHNHGSAADLKFMSPEARSWVHANAEKFGLAFPLSNEPWHIELASARSGSAPQEAPRGMAALVNRGGAPAPEGRPYTPGQAAQQVATAPQAPGTPAPAMSPPVEIDQADPPQSLLAMMGEEPSGQDQETSPLLQMMMSGAMDQHPPEPMRLQPMPSQAPQQFPALTDYLAQFLQSRTI